MTADFYFYCSEMYFTNSIDISFTGTKLQKS